MAELNKTLNIGEIVRLKGGGPPLTVCEYQKIETEPVKCVWFDDAGILRAGSFHPLTIERRPSREG